MIRGAGWIMDYGFYGFYIHKSIISMDLKWIWISQQLAYGSRMDLKS